MAQDLSSAQIIEKLKKQMPESMINETLSYYSELIEYAASLDNDAWNISNRESGKTFQLNCGHMYILRTDENKLFVMCDRDLVLSLPESFINKMLLDVTIRLENEYKNTDSFPPKNYEQLSKIPKDVLWHDTLQFYIPYEKLNEYMPSLIPAIKKFVEWSIKNSTLMQNSKSAHQKEFVSLINQRLGKTIKDPDYAHTTWVISSNPEVYDSITAFRELKTVDWQQSEKSSFKPGDFVYIFVSHKVATLKFKCVVKEINIPFENTIKDEKYVLNKENLGTSKAYMRLEMLKEYNGCAYTKDYLSLFGFKSPFGPVKLSSMGEQLILYLALIERLQAAKEIVPSEYDGSYELVSEVIKSYSKLNDITICDYNDLNLVYLSTVGTWKHSIEKKKETVNKTHLSDDEKSRLNQLLDKIWNKAQNKEYKHTELNDNVSIGMFGTGFYNTQTKTDNESVQKFIKLCVDLQNTDDEETAFTTVENTFKAGMKGLAAGGISQVLHCLKPFIFPILNSNQEKNNLFTKLGIKIEKANEEEYYAANCRKIKEYRDSNFEWKNYRNFDIEDLNMAEVSEEYVNFKCMLEYFVSHLEYIQNEDTTYVGYEKYIKPYVDKNNFKKLGQGYAGHNIQNQVSKWATYDCGTIFLNVANNYGDYKTRLCYLNWEDTGVNIIAKWDENEHIIGLVLHIYHQYKNGDKTIKDRKDVGSVKTLNTLGLFDGNQPNNELMEFLDDFKKLLADDQQTVINELEDKKMERQIEQLKNVKNIIFTGAPGTGKTYYAEEIAQKMNAVYKIVQFHPSYDYTDFVEGLRPVEKNGTLGFERKDGVFKEFCALALKNLEDSAKSKEVQEKEATVTDLIDEFISDATDNSTPFKITTGNEFFVDSSDQKYVYVKIPSNDKRNELTLQKQVLVDLLSADEKIKTSGAIRDFYNRKWRTQEDSYYFALYEKLYEKKSSHTKADVKQIERKDFVFIIDEINRGEVSKIFGELFYAIDPGYRGKKEKAVQTQYQNLIHDGEAFKDGFYVPENVYIIGTMNDIDRSVESIDFAFRRRFTWTEITAESSLSILDKDESWKDYGEKPSDDEISKLKNRLINLNKAISDIDGLNSAYHIGGSYLLKYASYNKAEAFEKLWTNHLQGVLFEYLRGRPQIDKILADLKNAYFNETVENEEDSEDQGE